MVAKRSSRDIRSESRLDVLHALLSAGTSTRNELAQTTGLSVATVATIVQDLRGEDLVVDAGSSALGAGRPTTMLRVNGERGRILGIDVAETYVRAIVFDASLEEIGSVEVPMDESLPSASSVTESIVRAVDTALREKAIDRERVLGAGIALPGLISAEESADAVAPRWAARNVEVLRQLRERIGLPLVVENPLKAIATAELWFGRGRTASSMVIANLGTGVGAGIVLEGKILRGATHSAGEWGHAVLVLDGRACRCGRRGCVEAYVGAPGIQVTLREIAPDHPLAIVPQREFVDGLASAHRKPGGDPVVDEVLTRTAHYLGVALGDLASIIDPEVLMLTGWTAWILGDDLVEPTKRELQRRAPVGATAPVDLGVSTVRGSSVAIGMATLAFERFLGDVGLSTTRLPLAL
ncbi:Sugar kinase of the NBD/HSP70 family, may contain an N-terminal HTH domain [Microbacterium sp. LKL04]|uniref:ROK family transcriptional regulator n=1 Tax=unclassified Microbacterium TaxID=2609290 RepID=UPI000875CF52|nr:MULTISPECIES: ROK family transcriptional regulator [unclassified Microbacterium]MDQ1127370.1 putative NBD/HSP70 family sugar kinase [Microbacterium sp. SORGH_AS_0505]SCY20878.1 Sugar kinase of the NBD/HSP70 family, may contain an N-terminal HTH domain [Microbacterium sp. LKL04]